MRGSLVIIAALCVAAAAAAEASSVRFVSADEGKNGEEKTQRSEVSEAVDTAIKKEAEEVVKKINDGEEELKKTIEDLDAERSEDGAGGSVKKAASSEKSTVRKRDVRRALEQLAKREMKRAEEANIFNARKIVIKYLSLQKTVTSKITTSLMFAIDRLEADAAEKEALITALKTFQRDLEDTYDNAINSLASAITNMQSRKFVRDSDIPVVMKTVNQRNPLMLVPIIGRLINGIAGAAGIADIAQSMAGSRSSNVDLVTLLDMFKNVIPLDALAPLADFM